MPTTLVPATANGTKSPDEDDPDFENMSLGEHLIAAYKDVVADRYTSVKTTEELKQYLESLAED